MATRPLHCRRIPPTANIPTAKYQVAVKPMISKNKLKVAFFVIICEVNFFSVSCFVCHNPWGQGAGVGVSCCPNQKYMTRGSSNYLWNIRHASSWKIKLTSSGWGIANLKIFYIFRFLSVWGEGTMIFGEIMRTIIFLSLPMITMTICAVVITMNDDSDDDLCEGGGNCRLSAEPRVADIPGPEHLLIIVINLASLTSSSNIIFWVHFWAPWWKMTKKVLTVYSICLI